MQFINILLVEDNPADADLAMETMEAAKLSNEVHVVRDGDEALDFLYQREQYTDAPRPDLILLDLNLPKRDGREVLQEIKEDSALRTIPVVVLTSSDAQIDIIKSYGLHCNAYIRKPTGLAGYISVVKSIDDFWFRVATLPRDSS